MRTRSLLVTPIVAFLCVASSHAATTRVYVDARATGADDGSSWNDAYTTISAAFAGTAAGDALEVWVAGTVTEDAQWDHGNLVLLGGFVGDESDPSQRDPVRTPTPWSGSLTVHTNEGTSDVVVDGFRIAAAHGPAIGAYSLFAMQSLRLSHVDLQSDDDWAIDGMAWEGETALTVSECRLEYNVGGLTLMTYTSKATVDVSRCTFEGHGGTGIAIEDAPASPLGWWGPTELMLTRSTIHGGERGVSVRAVTFEHPSGATPYTATAILASNVITGVGDAVVAQASYEYCPVPWDHGDTVTARVTAVGNTITGNSGNAFGCTARATYPSCLDGSDSVTCTIDAWDNLVTSNGGHAFVESTDEPARNVVVATHAVGNDLFENARLFLFHGTRELRSVAAVNALPQCRDNFDAKPHYARPHNRDFHLLGSSPAIDRGHLDAPFVAPTDLDGAPRSLDGNGDGVARPDVGAYEFHR